MLLLTLCLFRCVSALVAAVIAGKIHTSELAQSVCRCLCLLSYYYTKVEVMVVRCNVLLALHAIYRMGFCASSTDTCAMIAIILQNFTKAQEVCYHNLTSPSTIYFLPFSIHTDLSPHIPHITSHQILTFHLSHSPSSIGSQSFGRTRRIKTPRRCVTAFFSRIYLDVSSHD